MIEKNKSEVVSIVLPVYNGSKTIKKSLKSILDQTYTNFKIYICNDASTDSSLDIIKKINSKKIHLINNKVNIGLSKSRKKIIGIAKGDYLAFIDQDDFWHKNKLEKQLQVLNEKGCSMCHTNYTFICKKLNVRKKIISNHIVRYEDMKKGNTIGASTVVINKNIFKKTLNFCDDRFFDSVNDYVIWLFILRPSKNNDYSYGIKKSMVEYTFDGSNLSRNKLYQLLKHFIVLYRIEKISFIKTLLYYSCFNIYRKISNYFFR